MNLSELDKRITLQYKTKVPNNRGGFVSTWADFSTVWAKTWTVSSSEGDSGGQVVLSRTRKFKIQYRNVLKSEWRVSYKGKYYDITAIDPDENNEFVFLTCKEAA